MTQRKPRHVSFGALARILPACGSREAAHLLHVLQCEVCKDKALNILEPPPLPAQGEAYDEIFARVAAKTLKAHASRTRRRRAK